MSGTEHTFTGVRLIMQGGSVRDCRSSGSADHDIAAPWGPATATQIASISKQVVAVVALLLAERGLLELGDPVTAHLPEAPERWQAVTLRHLLTHTSGLPHWCERPGFEPAVPVAPEDRLRHLLDSPLRAEPGEVWLYSSPGYIVLAAALERAARRPYAELARELVLDPLRLGGTSIGSAPSGAVAKGYRGRVPVQSWDLHNMAGTGDVWSTAGDVATFITALHDGDLLPDGAQALLRDTGVPTGKADDGRGRVVATRYGLGHFIGSIDGVEARLHPGDNPGYQALAAWLPDTRTTLVVVSNDEQADLEAALVDVEVSDFLNG